MKKNILLIIPNLNFGGAQLSFHKLSEQLNLQHHVTNVVFNTDDIADYRFSGKLISLAVPASLSIIEKLMNFIQRVRAVRKLKKELEIDVCISFLEGADYVNILSKRREKIILSVRGSKFNDENIKGSLGWIRLHFLMPLLYKRTDTIVAVNEGIYKEMIQFMPPHKVQVINNSYNLAELKQRANDELEASIKNRITRKHPLVSIGRLSPEKGFLHLLRVFKLVIQKYDNCQVIIVGSGAMACQLIDECKNLNLSYDAEMLGFNYTPNADVIFTGYLPNPLPVLKRASVFTLCSSGEGFPNVILEAMCLGIPIISTDCPYGPNEILNPSQEIRNDGEILKAEYGILAPMFEEPSSYETWNHIIHNSLQDEQLLNQYGHQSEKRAADFSSEKNKNLWGSIILE